ncbi:MAG: peptidoglycan DD-metalloendopeptidase family protein [Firmicutes bacterium]|nr:peptidoglycan DD-metalloendopeptidase family protein [Bacillota bacterium]
MRTSVIKGLIRVWRNKSRFCLILVLALCLIFPQQMTGAAFSGKESKVKMEDVFKFRTDLIKEALLKAGFTSHYLKKNETLYRLSQKYYVSVAALKRVNQIANPHLIPVGEKLYIPPVEYQAGRLKRYQVKPGDSLKGLLSSYSLELWQFKRINPDPTKHSLKKGTLLYLPKKEINRSPRSTLSINLVRPVGGRITSRFGRRWGRMHYGIDLAASLGTPIRAAASGKVAFTGWNGGYGWFIKLDHGTYKTNYGHLSKIVVANGSYVQQGDLIGLVGATGRAYGSHLHFELEISGNKVDPLLFI